MASGPPPPPPPPTLIVNIDDKPLENPGTVEDLHKRCKEVFPNNFEGAKLMVNKGLSNHFQISHTLNMSSVTPSGYRFGATYVGTQQFGPNEAYPILVGDIDPSGNLNSNIIHKINKNTLLKCVAQVQGSKFVAVQLTTDYKGPTYTASLTLGNPDIINGSGVSVLHYLQAVTHNLALGGEVAYQYGPGIPGGGIAVISGVGKYSGANWNLSGTVGGAGLHLGFYQKASEQVQIGVELETNVRMQESVASIGYQVELPKANLMFRGMVDSNWIVGGTIEKKLLPLPFTFALSGLMNHPKNQFRMGCGLIIG